MSEYPSESVKAFWDSQAKLGPLSGSRDRIAKELEMRAIAEYVKDGMRVLDVGCGDGETGEYLMARRNIDWHGVDYSSEMIYAASVRLEHKGFKRLKTASVLELSPAMFEPFDLIYTQRCLINLDSWETQKQAILNMLGLLRPWGKLVLCECSQDGLRRVNELRQAAGLDAIATPWHNEYLGERPMSEFLLSLLRNRGPINMFTGVPLYFASQYAYLSRVVNAKLAAGFGIEPDYDSPINRLALSLPPLDIPLGQNAIWEIVKR